MAGTIESQEATRILTLIADSIQQSKDFVLEQAPDAIQQLVAWKRVETLIGVVVGLLLLAVAVYLARTLKEKAMKAEHDVEIFIVTARGCLAAIATLGGVGAVLTHASPCLQVWIAPKLFVIEYLADILKAR